MVKIKVLSNLFAQFRSPFSFLISLCSFSSQIKFIYCFEHIFMLFSVSVSLSFSLLLRSRLVVHAFVFVVLAIVITPLIRNLAWRFYCVRFFSCIFFHLEFVLGKNKNKLFIRCPFFYSIQCFCQFHATSIFFSPFLSSLCHPTKENAVIGIVSVIYVVGP